MKRSLLVLGAVVLVSAAVVGGAFAQIKPQVPPAASYVPPAGSPVALHGQLKVGLNGTKGVLLDKDNKPVTLRGMSFFWATSGEAGWMYYNDEVVGWLAYDWKVSVVRAAIGVSSADGEAGKGGYADGGAAKMLGYTEAVIEGCILRGVYVIVDWHTHKTEHQDKGKEFFGTIASKYGKYPNVLYEPFNEPLVNFSQVASYVNPMITEIRKNSDNLIIVGTSNYSQNPNEGKSPGGINDSKNNTAYSLHFYNNHTGLQGNLTTAVNNGLAVFVTEFGTCSYDGGNDNGKCPENTSVRECHDLTVNTGAITPWFTDVLEPNKVSWVNWAVTHKNEGASILKTAGAVGQWSASQLTNTGTYIRNQLRSYNSSYYPTSTYTVTATAGTGGKVEKRVGETVNNGPYAYGANVKVTAVPDDGWEFVSWSGDASGENETITGTITGVNLNVSANFYNGGLIKNGHFTSTFTSWSSNNNASLTPSAENGKLKAEVKTPGTAADGLRISQTGIKLDAGRKYVLTFKARGQSARTITPRLTNGTGTIDYMGKTPISLTTEEKTYTVETSGISASVTNAILRFDCGGEAATWYLDDVKLVDAGASTGVAPGVSAERARTLWSVSNIGGALKLRGPVEAGAKALLYDTRGKIVKSMAAADGMTLNAAGIPAGSYFVVVKNKAGAEVLRSRVSFVR